MVICLEKRSVVLSLGGSQWAAFSLVFVFFCSFVVCLVSHFFSQIKVAVCSALLGQRGNWLFFYFRIRSLQ